MYIKSTSKPAKKASRPIKSTFHNSKSSGSQTIKLFFIATLLIISGIAIFFVSRQLTSGEAMKTQSRASEYRVDQPPNLTPAPGRWIIRRELSNTCVQSLYAYKFDSSEPPFCSDRDTSNYIMFTCKDVEKIDLTKGPHCYTPFIEGPIHSPNDVVCRTDVENPPRCMTVDEMLQIAHDVCGCGTRCSGENESCSAQNCCPGLKCEDTGFDRYCVSQ